MSKIYVIYESDPGFPATDQHPDAIRYIVEGKIVDAIGGPPSLAEIEAVLNPSKAARVRSHIEKILIRKGIVTLEEIDGEII